MTKFCVGLLAAAALVAGASPVCAQADSALAVTRAGTSLFRVNVDGNVGIGESSPSQRLTVKGGVRADSATLGRVRFPDGSKVESMRITPVAVTFSAGWANQGGGWAPARYYLDPAGVVHLTGRMRYTGTGGSGITLFVLPAGYRPSGTLTLSVPAASGYGYLLIYADGSVKADGLVNGTGVSLDGATFLAEQ
ncbi:MAG TPA: hypothetical protein VFJ16_22885 [Longimicrobium sp.]|nr:hypothetical protein [Longimicrobium sp.]